MKTALTLISLQFFSVVAFARDNPRLSTDHRPPKPKAAAANGAAAPQFPQTTTAGNTYDERNIAGWTVHVNAKLMEENAAAVEKALPLLQKMLEEIVRVVPAKAVSELQKVPFWINPEYPNAVPKAAYHPDSGWLRNSGRDPIMGKGIELTNARVFDAEVRRMPNFALHELAHGYHHSVIGFQNTDIQAAWQKAKASGKYEKALYQDAQGRRRIGGTAYAMSNYKEYFAETTEAFFSRNDVFPFTREELKQTDPEMFALLQKLWGTQP